jgi:hypothetical protein
MAPLLENEQREKPQIQNLLGLPKNSREETLRRPKT